MHKLTFEIFGQRFAHAHATRPLLHFLHAARADCLLPSLFPPCACLFRQSARRVLSQAHAGACAQAVTRGLLREHQIGFGDWRGGGSQGQHCEIVRPRTRLPLSSAAFVHHSLSSCSLPLLASRVVCVASVNIGSVTRVRQTVKFTMLHSQWQMRMINRIRTRRSRFEDEENTAMEQALPSRACLRASQLPCVSLAFHDAHAHDDG